MFLVAPRNYMDIYSYELLCVSKWKYRSDILEMSARILSNGGQRGLSFHSASDGPWQLNMVQEFPPAGEGVIFVPLYCTLNAKLGLSSANSYGLTFLIQVYSRVFSGYSYVL